MRGYFTKGILALFCLSLFHLFSFNAQAQEEGGLKMGEFQGGGSIEVGYRFADIDGSRNRYKEVVNLMDGLRLFDLSLNGTRPGENKGWVDYFSFRANDLGDPYPRGRLEIKKNKTYDLVASYSEAKYFYNRQDDFFLTDNHDFDSTLRRGTLALTLFPKEDVRLNLGYRYTGRDGDAGVPRLNFPVALDQDLQESVNEYFVSAAFPLGNWNFDVKQSYWNYRNENRISDPLYYEKLDGTVDTYVTTLRAHTEMGERWDLDAGYVFAHSQGDSDLTTSPEIGALSGRGDFDLNTHIFELGLSYLLRKSLILHFDYQFHSLNQDGEANTDPLAPAAPNADADFSSLVNTGSFQLEYLPRNNLTLRAGYRLQWRDVEGEDWVSGTFSGGKDPDHTTTLTHGWIGSADWKPYKFLTFYGEYQGAHFDNPYTWISPETQSIAKVRVRYDTPIQKLSLKGAFSWKYGRNPDHEYRVDAKDYTFTASYQPKFAPKLSLDASVTYEDIDDKVDYYNLAPGSVSALRFDSDALIYTAGITYEGIYRGLGAKVYGSYAKSYNENSERYADGVFSFWYKNKWLTPIVTFERTYLVDKVNRDDGFDANLVTFSLRKEF